MSGLLIPILLTLAGLFAALATYRGIRRGGARFYTLEREAMLRRANFTLMGSVLLFLAAIALLVLERQQTQAAAAPAGEDGEGVATLTAAPQIQQFPPTPTLTPTPDLTLPTPTATPVVCRASIENTGGSGLTLRSAPGGAEVRILPEGSIVTMLDEEPVLLNGFTWRRVRVLGGEEGWVAEDFLTFGAPCN